jgi:hypothetical protein
MDIKGHLFGVILPLFRLDGLITKNEYSNPLWLEDLCLVFFYPFSELGE